MRKRKKQKKKQKRRNPTTPRTGNERKPPLVLAVDMSRKKKTMFSLVSIEETKLPKLQQFTWLQRTSSIKDKKAKRHYAKKFPIRFQQIKPHLKQWNLSPDIRILERDILSVNYKLAIIDDNVLKSRRKRGLYSNKHKHIPESIAKKIPPYRPLMDLADNLAYFGRELYESSKNEQEFRKKLKKLKI